MTISPPAKKSRGLSAASTELAKRPVIKPVCEIRTGAAVAFAYRELKLVVEPGGAVVHTVTAPPGLSQLVTLR